jgi:O-antigen ligase
MDGDHTPMKHVWLFPIWLGSMLFLYQRLSPFLNLDLGIRVSPDRLLFLVILGLFLKSTSGRRTGSIIGWLMLAFAVICTISWLTTRPDAGENKLRWLNTIFQLACFPFMAYYIAKNSDYPARHLKRLLNGVLIIQSYLVFTALAERYQISWLVWPRYILDMTLSDQGDRLHGPFSNSSMLGAALVMNFGCLCLMTLYTTGAKRRYLYALIFLSCACVYFTSTRTVWLGLFAFLLIFYFSRTDLRKPARAVGLCFLAVALSGVGSKLSFYKKSLFSQRQETVEYRLINLEAGLRIFPQHPLFGIGYGGFAKLMRENESGLGVDEKTLTAGNENTWLGILVDLGLVGLFVYVTIFALLIRSNIQFLRQHDTDQGFARPLAAVALGMTVYLVINWNTGDLRFHLYDPCLAFLVQGMAARWGKLSPEQPTLGAGNLEQIFEDRSDFNVDEAIPVGTYHIQGQACMNSEQVETNGRWNS